MDVDAGPVARIQHKHPSTRQQYSTTITNSAAQTVQRSVCVDVCRCVLMCCLRSCSPEIYIFLFPTLFVLVPIQHPHLTHSFLYLYLFFLASSHSPNTLSFSSFLHSSIPPPHHPLPHCISTISTLRCSAGLHLPLLSTSHSTLLSCTRYHHTVSLLGHHPPPIVLLLDSPSI